MDTADRKSKANLGIIVQQLGTNQIGYSLNTEGSQLEDNMVVFYNEVDILTSPPKFAMMQTVHLRGFKGILIATDLESAYTMKEIPTNYNKFLYVWNLEWLYQQYIYEYLAEIYLDPSINLIARSTAHANLLSLYWKKPKYVIKDFEHNALSKLIKSESVQVR